MHLQDSTTRSDLETAWEIVSKSTWSFYSSFLPGEQEIIERAVNVDSIRGLEGGGKELKDFIQQELAKMN